jgi:hypothetical protein
LTGAAEGADAEDADATARRRQQGLEFLRVAAQLARLGSTTFRETTGRDIARAVREQGGAAAGAAGTAGNR